MSSIIIVCFILYHITSRYLALFTVHVRLYFIVGGLLGPVASLISTPFELVKTQLQLQHRDHSSNHSGSSVKRGTFSMTRFIVETKSIKGLYTGIP